jgi:hypothetical protein
MQSPKETSQSESKRFDATVRKVLSVSHEEMKQREEEWKRQRANRKAGRQRRATAKESR